MPLVKQGDPDASFSETVEAMPAYMDLDPPENVSHLVVDTNYLVSHIHTIDALEQMSREYGLRIAIPATAVRELDGLKTRPGVSKDARRAIDWIFAKLSQRAPSVISQRQKERLRKNSGDDAILDYALWLRDKFPGTLQILLTNDKNLSVKALSEDIRTVGNSQKPDAKLIASTVLQENIRLFGHLPISAMPIDPAESSKTEIVEKRVRPAKAKATEKRKEKRLRLKASKTTNAEGLSLCNDKAQKLKQVNALISAEIRELAQKAVTHCIEKEYGDEPLPGYDPKQKYLLKKLLQLIDRFWFPVFRDVIRPSARANAEKYKPRGSNVNFYKLWIERLTDMFRKWFDKTNQEMLDGLAEKWIRIASKHAS